MSAGGEIIEGLVKVVFRQGAKRIGKMVTGAIGKKLSKDEAKEALEKIAEQKLAKATRKAKEKVKYASTYKERLNQTPKNGPKGKWTGKRGESTYNSTDPKANEVLKKDGVDGIKYDDAIPDFSPVSKGTVKIEGMTNNRPKNFDKADAALAKERGVTPKKIKQWREENGLTWHECNDTKTMQAVPTKINGTFGHLGGVGEINAASR